MDGSASAIKSQLSSAVGLAHAFASSAMSALIRKLARSTAEDRRLAAWLPACAPRSMLRARRHASILSACAGARARSTRTAACGSTLSAVRSARRTRLHAIASAKTERRQNDTTQCHLEVCEGGLFGHMLAPPTRRASKTKSFWTGSSCPCPVRRSRRPTRPRRRKSLCPLRRWRRGARATSLS